MELVNGDALKVKLNNIIWHIETNRKSLGSEITLDNVLESLKNLEKDMK